MATLIFKRAHWCLEISRSSRNFSVSFSTSFPRHTSRQNHHDRLREAIPSAPSSIHETLHSRYSRKTPSRNASHSYSHQARSIASSARFRQATSATATSPSNPPSSTSPTTPDLSSGFNDHFPTLSSSSSDPSIKDGIIDWSRSFHGLSQEAFPKETADALLEPIDPLDVEVKPDGILYLPEIKYRRIMNKAFGPGAWGMAPRGETIVTSKAVTREYALVALGRLVSIARGEQDYFAPEGIPTASEGCKSNALMRCCKDLGVASELWDPRFIRRFVADHVKEVWVEHQVSKKKRKIFMRKEDKVGYPYKESKG